MHHGHQWTTTIQSNCLTWNEHDYLGGGGGGGHSKISKLMEHLIRKKLGRYSRTDLAARRDPVR